MIYPVAEEMNRLATVKNAIRKVFIEQIDQIYWKKVESYLRNEIGKMIVYFQRYDFEYISDYLKSFEKKILFNLNGKQKDREVFIENFMKFFHEIYKRNVTNRLNEEVSKHYLNMAITELHENIFQISEIAIFLSGLADKICNDKRFVSQDCTNKLCNQNGTEFLNKFIEEKNLSVLVSEFLNKQGSLIFNYCNVLMGRYSETITYFFVGDNHLGVIFQIMHETSLEAVEIIMSEFKKNDSFSINIIELFSNQFEINNITDAKMITYTHEDYVREKENSHYNILPKSNQNEKENKCLIKTIKIKEGDTGYSYEKLFGDYLRGSRSIIIEDSFIEKEHQLDNFIRFCSVAKKFCSLEKIKLITKQCNKIKIDEKLKDFKQNLKIHKIEFEVEYSPTIHDRRIELDNGWSIVLGIGLDIYRHPGGYYKLETIDFSLRPCKQTNIDYFFKGNAQIVEPEWNDEYYESEQNYQ